MVLVAQGEQLVETRAQFGALAVARPAQRSLDSDGPVTVVDVADSSTVFRSIERRRAKAATVGYGHVGCSDDRTPGTGIGSENQLRLQGQQENDDSNGTHVSYSSSRVMKRLNGSSV